MRNWLIGCYIAEYELRGSDRARYGDRLFARLSFRLQKSGVSRSEERELRRYRRFYLLYPSIRESLTPELENRLLGQATNVALAIRESATPKSSAKDLIAKLSFTHIAQLIALDDEQKRSFYETECIQGGWSVRELKRQIASPNPPAPQSNSKLRRSGLFIAHTVPHAPFLFFGGSARAKRSDFKEYGPEPGGTRQHARAPSRRKTKTKKKKLRSTLHPRSLDTLAGMDNRLFVSKYQLHLPRTEQLRKQLEQTLKEQAAR